MRQRLSALIIKTCKIPNSAYTEDRHIPKKLSASDPMAPFHSCGGGEHTAIGVSE
jgi:hypothetical protein